MDIMPHSYNIRPLPQRPVPSGRRRFIAPSVTIIVILAIYAAYCLLRPIPHLKTTILPPVIPGQVTVDLPWPAATQDAFGTLHDGVLATHGSQTALPTASVAKVITALAVLSKKPLAPGQSGPNITLTDNDVAIHDHYVAEDGSTVPVFSGETITERQALEAMMLPSANNMADSTAIWAFGSLANYHDYASTFVKQLHMNDTTIGIDASGLSPTTTSTPGDLIRLGQAALQNPALKDIISERQAVFPNYGPIDNLNSLLGSGGVIGIKTGNNDQDHGVFLGAANVAVGGNTITVITAVMNAPTLDAAIHGTSPLLAAAASAFQSVQVVLSGQHVGRVSAPWGAGSDIVSTKSISVVVWNGTPLSPQVSPRTINAPAAAGTGVGTLSLSANNVNYNDPLTTENAIAGPTLAWRLTHPL